MTKAKQKNLAAVVAISLLYLLFLLNHYSILGAAVTGVSILILLMTNFALFKGEHGIVDGIGQYLGVSIFNGMLVLIAADGATVEEFTTRFKLSDAWGAILVCAIAGFVLGKIHTNSMRSSVLPYIIKYVALFIGGRLLLEGMLGGEPAGLTVWMVIYLAVTFFAEMIHNRFSASSGRASIYIWTMLNVILFSFMGRIFPMQTAGLLNMLRNLPALSWKWYSLLLVGVGALAVAIFCWVADKGGSGESADGLLCLVGGFDLLMIPYIFASFTKYSVIWFLALILLNVVAFFTRWPSGRTYQIFDRWVPKSETLFVLGALSMMLLHGAFVNGWLFTAIFLLAGGVCTYLLYHFKSGTSGWLFWAAIVLTLAGAIGDVFYRRYHAAEMFLYLAFAVALALLALAVVNVKNLRKPTADIGAKVAIVLFAAVMILFPARNSGVAMEIKMDDQIAKMDENLAAAVGESGQITVTLKPIGKENSVSTCYYYWDDNAEDHVAVTLDENSAFTLQPQNGCLHIYAEDANGVSSVKTRWFNLKTPTEETVTDDMPEPEDKPEGVEENKEVPAE